MKSRRSEALAGPRPVALAALLVTLAAVGACTACGKSTPGAGASAAAGGSAEGEPAARAAGTVDAAALRDRALWEHAKSGEAEDLASLATREGAAGLVEAAEDEADLRPVAIRAMAYAPGWAALPFLAKSAAGSNDDEARLALDAIVDLAARPRRAEDPEDVEELRSGCEHLAELARGAGNAGGAARRAGPETETRERRIAALRALRMMPCPKLELPTDLDAR